MLSKETNKKGFQIMTYNLKTLKSVSNITQKNMKYSNCKKLDFDSQCQQFIFMRFLNLKSKLLKIKKEN